MIAKSLLLSAVLAGLALLALAACGGGTKPSGKPVVVCTIFAYYDAARAIGGEDVDAEILLPPGQSPHDFTPTPEDKETVSRAALIVKNGLGLDDWITWLASDNTRAKVLSIGDELEAIQTREESLTAPAGGAGGEASAGARNPHVWLDPLNQIKAAEKIAAALSEIAPAHKGDFERRAAAYVNALRDLDADFRKATASFRFKQFVGFHSAYDYLARRYGLVQAASIEEIGAGGLNPAQIQHVIDLIRERHIPVVFTETAFDSKQAQMVINATGAKLGTLQPLETYDQLSDTYVGLMRENLDQLKKAMQ